MVLFDFNDFTRLARADELHAIPHFRGRSNELFDLLLFLLLVLALLFLLFPLGLFGTFSSVDLEAPYHLVLSFFRALVRVFVDQGLELLTPSNHGILLLVHSALTAHLVFELIDLAVLFFFEFFQFL